MKRKFGNSVSYPLEINIGCGNTGLDDWVNIDKSPLGWIANHKTLKNIIFKCKILPKKYDLKLPNNYLVHDIRKGLPFDDNSVAVIYSSHFFEHLTYFEARDLIKECYRVASPGAIIRIIVPDVELLVRRYIEKDREFNEILAKDRLQEWVFEGRTIDKIGFAEILSTEFYAAINVTDFWSKLMISLHEGLPLFNIKKKMAVYYHKWMYDFESMKLLLEYAGFKNVTRCEFQQGRTPGLDKLDNHEEFSLYVEAEK